MSERRVNAQGERGIMHANARWHDGPETPIVYANAILSQFTPHEFIVSFGQFTPPNTLNMSDEDVAAIDGVPVYSRVKIVLSPGRMLELLETLQQNWLQFVTAQEEFMARQQDEEDGDGEADEVETEGEVIH